MPTAAQVHRSVYATTITITQCVCCHFINHVVDYANGLRFIVRYALEHHTRYIFQLIYYYHFTVKLFDAQVVLLRLRAQRALRCDCHESHRDQT